MTDIEKQGELRKKQNVPLQEALNATGFGKYSIFLFLTGGLVHFSADCGIQALSIIIPAASCDLNLSSYQKGLLASMGTTGMMASANLCGILADVYGRRKVLLGSLIMQAVLCIVSSLAPDAQTLMISWFFYGNVAAGVMTPVLVYINEFCSDSTRTLGMVLLVGFGAIAETYLASVAWLIIPLDISFEIVGGVVFKSWRLYLAVLSLPAMISTFLLLKFPESPKFVLNNGKVDKTLHILQTIYSINNNDAKENFPISSIELDMEDKLMQGTNNDGRSFLAFLKLMFSKTAILFNKTFIGYTLLSSITILGIGGM